MEEQIQGQTQIEVSSEQQTLFSLEELTVKVSNSIGELKNQLKEVKQSIKEHYVKNGTYAEQQLRTEGEKKQLADIKKEINSYPEVATLLQNAKDMQGELNEKQAIVSDYALDYAEQSGNNQIDRNGVRYDIVKSARLVIRKQ